MASVTNASLLPTTTSSLYHRTKPNSLVNLNVRLPTSKPKPKYRTITSMIGVPVLVAPAVIVGSDLQLANALKEMGTGQDLLLKAGQPVPVDFSGPIFVCTRNDDLDDVLESTPKSRWNDLVFFQDGMLEPWFQSKGLIDANQVLPFFDVSRPGEPPVDGITDVTPEGLTAAFGKWAPAVASRLHAGGLSCKVLEKEAFQKKMIERLLWISAFMLTGARFPGHTMGDVASENHLYEVVWLMGELQYVAYMETGNHAELFFEKRLLAYSKAVSHIPAVVEDFKWRNGWFYSISEKAIAQGKEDPCPLHTRWVRELNLV